MQVTPGGQWHCLDSQMTCRWLICYSLHCRHLVSLLTSPSFCTKSNKARCCSLLASTLQVTFSARGSENQSCLKQSAS